MAKIVKKKPAAKAAAKPAKKAPAKAAAKPAPKKPAPKAVVKKKADKAPVKAAKKPEAKKKPEVKPAKAPVKAAKETKEVKETKVEAAKKLEKKATPQPTPEKAAPKKEAKAPKKGKAKKEKDEEELEDDYIADDDMMGDEIGEYEEELKAVEESEEEVEVDEEWVAEEKVKGDEEVVLTDAEGRRYCRARDCDQIAIVDAYCRYHYLMFWKKIQVRKKILQDGKLERYVEELTSRYPDKFLEMIRRDLRTEKDFLAAIQELEIDESAVDNEFEEDNSAFIEEVRGMGEGSGSSVEDDEY
ncbi:hypothetical protein EZJ49_10270 [Bdellovibrio bacteriovorus]|uniref:hypothetical protein n=1 Tax=Bdellovibrio bacteriovorus TaxID=959 RepID=UPI0021D3BA97|nr:hypothetical protein [Bdellovibrio bacteriovorus]UXR63460.1 hypothetical protein EZJ49_10270 [Bdellovibrio bacteriovorus]